MTHPMRLASLGGATTTYVDDVFSTYLYTGNGGTQTITNGIDLSGNGGMVWIKGRSGATDHALYDTVRGATKDLVSNSTAAETTQSTGLTSFSSTGFAIGALAKLNTNADIYSAWTFRRAAKFFDVVTWTGDGVTNPRNISHSLGTSPGMIVIKCTSSNIDFWTVWHRSLTANNTPLRLSTTAGGALANGYQGYVSAVSSTNFTISHGSFGDDNVNNSASTYVAYLFAHDTAADGLIQCGSFTTDGSGNATVNLGWEPQFSIIKSSSSAIDWYLLDTMRGWVNGTNDAHLYPNQSVAEASAARGHPTATGFDFAGGASTTYIYLAIRRPNKPPTSGTQVFMPTVYTGTNVDNRLVDTTIAPDMVWVRQRNDTVLGGMVVGDRLRGQPYLLTGTTAAEVNDADAFDAQLVSAVEYGTAFSAMNGFWCGNDATAKLNANTTSNNHIAEAFKRAPGFFDVVCYTGTGSATTVAHNLGVVPEMIITKASTKTYAGRVYHLGMSNTEVLYFYYGPNDAKSTETTAWNSTTPTSTVFTVGTGLAVNESTTPYVAYLFASLPGISKVFSYTGNGTSQTINCGFAAGARFVLIKRTDSTGDWYVWDSARGIIAADDPHLSLNSTAAEVTTDDSVDTDSTGFVVNQLAATNVNVNTATYIGIAIA